MVNLRLLPRLALVSLAFVALEAVPLRHLRHDARAEDGDKSGSANAAEGLRYFETRWTAITKACADKLWEAAASAKSANFHEFAVATADEIILDWNADHADARELLGYAKKGKDWVIDPSVTVPRQNTKNTKESQKSFDDRIRKWREFRAKVNTFVAAKVATVGADCAAKGFDEQARKAAERAVALDPDCEAARKTLGFERFGKLWVTKEKAAAIKRATEGKAIEGASKLDQGIGTTLSKIGTPHFRVEDDGAKEALPDTARALETMYAYYLADVGRDPTEDVFGGKVVEMCVVSTQDRWEKWVDQFSEAKDKKWTKESNTYRNYTDLRTGTLRVATAESVDTRDPLVHHAAHLLNQAIWKCGRTAWIDEGLAYYYTVKVQDTTRTSCLAQGESGGYAKQESAGGEKDWTISERWKSFLRPMVAKKADQDLRKIMGTPLATLDLSTSVKAWGVISYLMDTHREKFQEFLKRLRDRKDPAAESQEDVFQSVFAMSIEAMDTEWRAFALRAY